MRYFLEISYDGTAYHGWQIQPNAISIQEVLEKALSTILKEKVRIHGSSRTDTGVHARQQFAHFDLNHLQIPLAQLTWKLNSFLPNDLCIRKIDLLSSESHSRFDALSRKYIYRIHTEDDPFSRQYSWLLKRDLDIEKMNEASQILLSYEDFQCFSKVKTDVNNFNCAIEVAEWKLNQHQIHFHIQANRFLRGMVRAVVGTLLDVGLGKMSIMKFEKVIISRNRNEAGRAVPAHGLTLEEVNYPIGYFCQK